MPIALIGEAMVDAHGCMTVVVDVVRIDARRHLARSVDLGALASTGVGRELRLSSV